MLYFLIKYFNSNITQIPFPLKTLSIERSCQNLSQSRHNKTLICSERETSTPLGFMHLGTKNPPFSDAMHISSKNYLANVPKPRMLVSFVFLM
jgi:hypothetical protein